MKKVLGISLVAMLAVAPLAARAELPSVSVPGSEISTPAITPNTHIATTSYVQGAHRDAVNTAIAYVNAENTRATAVEGTLANLTTTDKTSLVAAINEVATSASNASDSYKDLADLSAAGNSVIDARVTANARNASFSAAQNTDLAATTLESAINELALDYKAADSAINSTIGNTALTTTSQTLTGAIEEVKAIAEDAAANAGDAESADFTAENGSNISATTIGDAINEVAADYQAADSAINDKIGDTTLTTTAQTLTGAIEEVKGTADDAAAAAASAQSAINNATLNVYSTWGSDSATAIDPLTGNVKS